MGMLVDFPYLNPERTTIPPVNTRSTQKDILGGAISTQQIAPSVVLPYLNPFRPNMTLDMAVSNYHLIIMSGELISLSVTNVKDGQSFAIDFIQDTTGGWDVDTWFSTIKWPLGTPFSLTGTATHADVLVFKWIGISTYRAFVGVRDSY